MTNLRIVYSVHAQGRMARREITDAMVRETLVLGVPGHAYTAKGKATRYAKKREFGGHMMQVVYFHHLPELVEVVTVEWLDYWKV